MKYLWLLIFISCNSSEPKQKELITTGVQISVTDSVGIALDSLKESLGNISAISDYAIKAQAKIDNLTKENKLHKELDNQPTKYIKAHTNPKYLDSITTSVN